MLTVGLCGVISKTTYQAHSPRYRTEVVCVCVCVRACVYVCLPGCVVGVGVCVCVCVCVCDTEWERLVCVCVCDTAWDRLVCDCVRACLRGAGWCVCVYTHTHVDVGREKNQYFHLVLTWPLFLQ